MVDKILAYETGGASLETTIALVSDNPDGAGDFHSNAEELADTVLASRTPRHIALEQLGTAATRQAILRTFDEGASVVSYIGHGGIDRWANESILQRSSVDSIRAPIPTASRSDPELPERVLSFSVLRLAERGVGQGGGEGCHRSLFPERAELERTGPPLPPSGFERAFPWRSSAPGRCGDGGPRGLCGDGSLPGAFEHLPLVRGSRHGAAVTEERALVLAKGLRPLKSRCRGI